MKEQIGSGHPEVIPKACSSGGPEVLLYRPYAEYRIMPSLASSCLRRQRREAHFGGHADLIRSA
jgi:hypothetical protein